MTQHISLLPRFTGPRCSKSSISLSSHLGICATILWLKRKLIYNVLARVGLTVAFAQPTTNLDLMAPVEDDRAIVGLYSIQCPPSITVLPSCPQLQQPRCDTFAAHQNHESFFPFASRPRRS